MRSADNDWESQRRYSNSWEWMTAGRGLSEHDTASSASSRRALDRLTSFSDAVFAIAMTLLVVQLTVPVIAKTLPRAEIGHQLASGLAALGPAYFSFGVSFVVIAAFWVAHHRRFMDLSRYDTGLIWLNLLLLLCIVFIPFPTAVLGRYGDEPVAAVFYAASLAVTGVVSGAVSIYADRRGLADPSADSLRGFRLVRAAVIPAVFLASIPVALASPSAAEWSWLTLLAANVVVNRFEEAYRRRRAKPPGRARRSTRRAAGPGPPADR